MSRTTGVDSTKRALHNIAVQEERQQQALLGWRQTILGALEEAENAIVAYTRERDRRATLASAVDATELARSDATVSSSLVALNKALGGGWETYLPAPDGDGRGNDAVVGAASAPLACAACEPTNGAGRS
jgi:outer membrane protein TolC